VDDKRSSDEVQSPRSKRTPTGTPGDAARQRVLADLVSVRRMSKREAERWCDAWERCAAERGLGVEDPFFWDAGRGWIDAQLIEAPSELTRRVARHLEAVRAARERARPGSRKHRNLLQQEGRLASRLKTLEDLGDDVTLLGVPGPSEDGATVTSTGRGG